LVFYFKNLNFFISLSLSITETPADILQKAEQQNKVALAVAAASATANVKNTLVLSVVSHLFHSF
jgi:hypothetical protein